MARQPRIEFPGAFYHVIVRGNQRQDIFIDDDDRNEYIKRLRHYKKKHGFNLYGYVLMSNHVHLLLETPLSPISKIMQVINFTYTQYFNRRYEKTGHLFQGRYKSYLCDRDAYLLSLVRYIHLNPVRAGMIDDIDAYRWSSHGQYLSLSNGLADVGEVLGHFSSKKAAAMEMYKDFMKEFPASCHDGSFYNVVEQQILGDDEFIDKIAPHIKVGDTYYKKQPLEDIVKAVEFVTEVLLKDMLLRSMNKKHKIARLILIRISMEFGYRLTDLQQLLERDLSVLSRWSNWAGDDKSLEAVEAGMDRVFASLQA